MKFGVKISGAIPHYDEAAVRPEVTEALGEIAEIGAENARQRVLQPPKTGRIYGGAVSFKTKAGKQVQFTAATHQASAPGEHPANWTGALVAATKSEVGDPQSLHAQFVAAKDYAVYLEKGTRKMAARPFMRPAALAAVSKRHLLIAAAVKRGLRKAAKKAK